MRVALVGAAGTGKTTLARQLAEALGPGRGVDVVDDPAPDRLPEFDLTLLMGVDLAGACEAMDPPLRQSLQRAGIAYQVVYGEGPARLQAALAAIGPPLAGAPPAAQAPVRWTWHCDRCGDAECEHRLFRMP